MTFLYREVLSATRLLPAKASSRRIRAIYLEHRLAATIDEKSLGVVVSNGNKRARAGCAFHSGFAYNQRKEKRAGERERKREEREEGEKPNRTATYRARVSPEERERETIVCNIATVPSFAPFASRSILSRPSDRQFTSQRCRQKRGVYVHSRECLAITTR